MQTILRPLILILSTTASPEWSKSSHINRVDTPLNLSMRIIAGTVRSFPCHGSLYSQICNFASRRHQGDVRRKDFCAPRMGISSRSDLPPTKTSKVKAGLWKDLASIDTVATWKKDKRLCNEVNSTFNSRIPASLPLTVYRTSPFSHRAGPLQGYK